MYEFINTVYHADPVPFPDSIVLTNQYPTFERYRITKGPLALPAESVSVMYSIVTKATSKSATLERDAKRENAYEVYVLNNDNVQLVNISWLPYIMWLQY